MDGRLRKRVLILLAALAVLYALDYGVWRARMASGNGAGEVTVDEFLSTPLKGQKERYDYIGAVPVACSRSLFPHGRMPVCWWLTHHRSQWQ